MNDIFQDFIANRIIIVYLDNILIFIWILEDYWKTVHKILKDLAKYKLFLYPKKCEFDKWQIEYLGLVISEDQVAINLIKVVRVCN